jgi:Holliday junction resolvase RusA-like endonuclease
MFNPSSKGMNKLTHYAKNYIKEWEQYSGQKFVPFNGPLLVICHFRLSLGLNKKPYMRRRKHLLPHTLRPDGDNLEKFLNDSLNGVIWSDDARIVWLFRSKTYTSQVSGHTVLYVRQLDDGKPNYDLIIQDIIQNINLESYDEDALARTGTDL